MLDNILVEVCWTVLLFTNFVGFAQGQASQFSSNRYLAQSCPKGCQCIRKTVRCINIQLDGIPTQNIPLSTKVLDVRYNYIRDVKATDFDHLPNLESLFLGNNLLRKIEPYSFQKLRKLKHLYLFSNKLQSIDQYTYSGLRNLEQLYLQNNGITHIAKNALKDLVSLNRLYLHRNALRSVSKEAISPLIALKRLRLESNNIQCTCEFVRLVKEITLEGNVYIGATCYLNRRERTASSLKYSDLQCYRPKFLVRPFKTLAVAGTTVKLLCKADGSPVPTISWIKDGGQISEKIDHEVTSDGTLVLNNFSVESTGYYECLIENILARDNAGATVSIVKDEVLPTFSERPSDVDAILNSIALFNCRASGYPRANIVWVKNGHEIEANNRFNILPTGDLEIKALKIGDSGYYTCRAENNIGSVTHTARLIVKAPPVFVRTPKSRSILDGQSTQFECKASGYPPPAIAWQKDGKRLPSDGRHIVLPSGTLRVLYARKQNEGTYQCQAINVIGVISVHANLTVRSRIRPRITLKPPDMTVQSGNTIFFRCTAEGAPQPVIYWVLNGVQVATGNRFTVDSAVGTLEIKDIGNVDAGRWECVARNSIASASESFTLTVIGPKNGNYEGDQFVHESLKKAQEVVDRAISITRQKLQNFTPRSPADLLALFRFPSPDAIKIARSAEIFEISLELVQKSVDSGILHKDMTQKYHFNGLVSPEHIRLLANLSGCTAHHRLVNCSDLCFHHKYRAFDGTCNNFEHPMLGASLTPFSRLLIPNYENGFNTPFGWNNTELPSARAISLKLLSSKRITPDKDFTHMLMQFGQFLDHDMDFFAASPSTSRFNDGRSCQDSCENEQPCFPIKIPEDDPRIKRYKCMEFTRSSAVCGSGSTSVFFDSITPRQQINQITSFIDASNVYGSNTKDANDLRSFEGDKGLLKQGIHATNGKFLLPFNQDTPIDCMVNTSVSRVPCFLAGDHRANEQLGLIAMHTLWMRQHNRLAGELRRLNPHWKGEKIYQESRKIVGAQMQHIAFTAWLPKILGPEGVKKLGKYNGYDPNTDPSIVNTFSTAAFRFGHTMIQPILARLNATFDEIPEGNLPLHKAFFSPYRIVEEGGIDPLLRGLFGTAAKGHKKTLNNELTEHLFEMAHTVALDLAALNIQRGRDHGIPTYNNWRQFCNLTVATSFDGFKNEIQSATLREKLQKLYVKIDNVDLFVAGILEDPVLGSRIGPTFLCLIALQFKRLRDGDRLWYENPGVFTPPQLNQLKQTTLAGIICDNSDDIRHVQRDVFKRVEGSSEYTPCFQHPKVDLRFWKECCTGKQSCPTSGQSATINFVSESVQPVRKRRAVLRPPLSQPTNETVYDAFQGKNSNNNWISPKDSEYQQVETEYQEKDSESKLRHRVRALEKRINKFDKILNEMKHELSYLKRYLPTKSFKKKTHKWRPCINLGIVRGHGENWFDNANRKCSCYDKIVTCS